jgi:hypothetical protein
MTCLMRAISEGYNHTIEKRIAVIYQASEKKSGNSKEATHSAARILQN